ncbi:hypothetical protein ASPACDRAFT_48130 [Aspergillus aculeatus ATCC 16872]|uniref:Uncharacterized protein n=1 Tax=Aspergillus aculeatus (strain ATCC 16872 / CBS 172.66 / WB 5094) TaxID=690307 RepID=A0A1L9WFR7_ASPA1|nr:uncharacterized protein ASPACDRAFT_48130 [Aspergillus aculeatus ATCC 16872]OJJ95026.1 hypothetical protein ASPACDRAFT_48130 [Aspergillus aculeatus ATCC 16872]
MSSSNSSSFTIPSFMIPGWSEGKYPGSACGKWKSARWIVVPRGGDTRGGLELVSYHWGHYAPTLARLHREGRERARKLLDPDFWQTSPWNDWKPTATLAMVYLEQALAALGDPQIEATIRAMIRKYVGAAAVARMDTDNTQQPRHPTPFKHGHECQVCCRPLGDNLQAIFWCKRYCGYAAHAVCIRKWCRGRASPVAPRATPDDECRCRRRRRNDADRQAFLAVPPNVQRQISQCLREQPRQPLEWHSLY